MEALQINRSQFDISDMNFDTMTIDNGEYTTFVCDECECNLKINTDCWYNHGPLDYCKNCFSKVRTILGPSKLIDRTALTIKEKPLNWKCDNCFKALGGGHKWYLFGDDLDICDECYQHENPLYKAKYMNNDGSTIIISRSDPLIINIAPVKDHVFEVPTDLLECITEDRNKLFISLIGEIVFCDLPSSILKWTMFTDFENIGFYPAHTALAIMCEYPYPIASLCDDDHGRVSMVIIYDTYDEYKQGLSEWKLPDDDILNARRENIQMLMDEGSVDDDVCADGALHFSQYIRMKRVIPMYFG
jgi:hypothetical protein